jgi:hypothetical protein
MSYQMLCKDVQRERAKPSPDQAFGLFCYVPLHNIRYGISFYRPIRVPHRDFIFVSRNKFIGYRIKVSRFFHHIPYFSLINSRFASIWTQIKDSDTLVK